jgi:hypothetical protein
LKLKKKKFQKVVTITEKMEKVAKIWINQLQARKVTESHTKNSREKNQHPFHFQPSTFRGKEKTLTEFLLSDISALQIVSELQAYIQYTSTSMRCS